MRAAGRSVFVAAAVAAVGLLLPAAGQAAGGHLYWANSGGGTIVEANLDGSDATTIDSGQNNPIGVAVGP